MGDVACIAGMIQLRMACTTTAVAVGSFDADMWSSRTVHDGSNAEPEPGTTNHACNKHGVVGGGGQAESTDCK